MVDKNLNFEQILETISDAEMMKTYDGLSLGDFGKNTSETDRKKANLDNKTLSEEEQRFNLAFYAKASMSHVGWNGFGEDNQNKLKEAVEELYNQIDGSKNQKEFMEKVGRDTKEYIQDRHFMLMTGSGSMSGGHKREVSLDDGGKPLDVGRNMGYGKDNPKDYERIDFGADFNDKGEEYLLWEIGKINKNGEDILVVSIPNLGRDDSYEYWEKFIKTFDEEYAKISKNENSRVILDVRGNGGGEDKPIDHVAKRLYGNMVNTYKRCEINDSAISNKFLHAHGAYKPENYEKDGIKKEDLIERKHFSNTNQTLFDETQTYYPFNEKDGYKGRIDVLIDKKVGSSAESAYTSFYHHPKTRYIGENTAGMQQFTQGSFAMPCGYLMRVGVTKLTYWDKEGQDIEVKGHKPDVECTGQNAMTKALTMDKDENRVMGFREKNESTSENMKYVEYDPKAKTDPRKAYYAKYLEQGLTKVEQKNINDGKIANLRNKMSKSDTKVPYKPTQDVSKSDFKTLKKYQDMKQAEKEIF